MSKLGTPWSDRRRAILAGMGENATPLRVTDRDREAIAKLLETDGVIEPVDDERHRITPAGKVLTALHRLHDNEECGPWSLSDIRRFSAVKKLDIEDCRTALKVLEERQIVQAEPSARTPKWDFAKAF